MTKRIFRSICFAALTVFFATVILIMGFLYEYFSDAALAQLKMQTNLAAQGVTNEGMEYFRDLESADSRITWIDAAGNVLYDSGSDTANMENHLEREEVREALLSGYGESKRYSSTLRDSSFYSAQKLGDGSILRLSISQNSMFALFLGMAQPVFVIFMIALVLSIALAIRISRKIVKPINEMDLDDPLSNVGYEELSPFLHRIDSQQQQLRKKNTELLQKENELSTIIGSMNEGMVLLNPKGEIISMNPAAGKILDAAAGYSGDMFSLCRTLNLQGILSEALCGRRGKQVIPLHEESYQVDADPIISENVIKGAALFFFNVTEKEKSEKIRREFTANVSHELKTPLHSISGYAELLKNDMVKEEDRIPFAGKIYDEAGRMIRLVEDIISLSHLDEGAADMAHEKIDLYETAKKAVQSLEPEAVSAGVTLELSGSAVILNGIPHLLYSMVYNLCDNGIKYNRKDGKVVVTIRKEDAAVVLSVRDTGIGIAPEHQERIFERFYRVDKSHSKRVGGTGLGLSIVKHAARVHNADIEVNSSIGNGTEVLVRFPEK